MPDAFIVSAVRTPIGRFLGALKGIPATRLGAHVVREAVPPRGTVWGDKVTYLVTSDARGELAFVALSHERPDRRVPKEVAQELGVWWASDDAFEAALEHMAPVEEVALSSTAR